MKTLLFVMALLLVGQTTFGGEKKAKFPEVAGANDCPLAALGQWTSSQGANTYQTRSQGNTESAR